MASAETREPAAAVQDSMEETGETGPTAALFWAFPCRQWVAAHLHMEEAAVEWVTAARAILEPAA